MIFSSIRHIKNKSRTFVLLSAAFCLLTTTLFPLSVADFNPLPQDEDGWTVLVPDAESRLIYVDSEVGNDSTGQIYAVGDSVIGADPQAPVGNVLAFKTLSAAYARARTGQPDWMLLRAGRIWENESLQLRRGLSATARFVVCPYGEGARPELRTGSGHGIAGDRATNVVVSGIKFWAHTRDEDGPYFTSFNGGDGFSFVTQSAGAADQIRNVLIENCYFRSYQINRLAGRLETGRAPVERFVMRRSIVSGYYGGFSIGFSFTGAGQPPGVPPSVLLEENTFYHNGWRVHPGEGGPGEAEITNHNTYFSGTRNVLFKGNFFLSGSSIENKWTANSGTDSAGPAVMEDNFYYGGEIGISAGGNNPGALRFTGFRIRNNVFSDIGKERPTNRSLAWYMDVQDWNGGEVTGNLLLNQTLDGLNNVYAMSINAADEMQDVLIANNIVYNIESGRGPNGSPLVLLNDVGNVTDVEFSNNVIHATDGAPPIGLEGFGNGYSLSGLNSYYSSRPANTIFRFEASFIGLDFWRIYAGDSEATVAAPDWEDPDRNVERYVQELGLGSTFDDFLEALHQQSKSNWRTDLTAPAVNDWFRAGFVSPTLTPDSWGPFPRDDNGNVDTEDFLGVIYAPAEWESWIWVQSANQYFYLPEEHVSDSGAWAWVPLF